MGDPSVSLTSNVRFLILDQISFNIQKIRNYLKFLTLNFLFIFFQEKATKFPALNVIWLSLTKQAWKITLKQFMKENQATPVLSVVLDIIHILA